MHIINLVRGMLLVRGRVTILFFQLTAIPFLIIIIIISDISLHFS